MDAADSDFLKQMFRENNDLRVKYTALQRDLFNKTLQCEHMEGDIRSMAMKLDEVKSINMDPKRVCFDFEKREFAPLLIRDLGCGGHFLARSQGSPKGPGNTIKIIK